MRNVIYFEDIVPGSRQMGGTVTVDPDEMLQFARVWDPLPIHVDTAIAHKDMGGLTAPGLYLLALKQRLLHGLIAKPAVIASFGYDEVRFLRPVFGGDRLTLVVDWVEKRISTSKPDRGIVVHRLSLLDPEGTPVMSHLDTILVRMAQR